MMCEPCSYYCFTQFTVQPIYILGFAEGMQPLQAIQEILLQFEHQGARQSSNAQRVVSDWLAG